MQYSTDQTRGGYLALATAIAVALLLGIAPFAKAQDGGVVGAGAVDAVGAAVESAAGSSAEGTVSQSSTPVVPPEQASVTAPATPPASEPASTPPEPSSNGLGAPERQVEPVSTALSAGAEVAEGIRNGSAKAVASTTESVASATKSIGAPTSPSDVVKNEVGGAVEHVTGSARSSLQEAAARSPQNATTRSLEKAGRDLIEGGAPTPKSLAKAVVAVLAAAEDLIPSMGDLVPSTDEASLPASGTDGGLLSPSSAGSVPGSLRGSELPGERLAFLTGLPLQSFAGPEAIAAPRWWALALGRKFAVRGSSPMPVAGDSALSGGGNGRRADPVPPAGNVPRPPSETSPAAASGLGGSSFVPIVALLALLALAVPATFRRLREMADLAAPAPCACALERPG